LGAIWPFIVGLLGIPGALLTTGGVLMTVSNIVSPYKCSGAAFPCRVELALLAGGLILLTIGAVNVSTGIGIWRQRTWGRWLGAALGSVGLVITAWIRRGDTGFWELVVLALGYGLTLAGAIVWYPADAAPAGP
jgi:hypothetical protein